MSDQKSIYVYYTVDPNYMAAYAKWIGAIFFGVKVPDKGNNDFRVNKVTGHFSCRVNTKYVRPSKAPQTEQEARILAEKVILDLNKKLHQANVNSHFPKDFPQLFNTKFLNPKVFSPIYDEAGLQIIAWKAVYGIELPTYAQDSSGIPQKRSVLKGDSITIEISGNTPTFIGYSHLPIVSRKSCDILLAPSSEFVYRRTNVTTLAPYFITENGFIPACGKSIPIQTEQVSSFSSDLLIKNAYNSENNSFISLSDINPPSNGYPGSAKIVLSMQYHVVTEGPGMVDFYMHLSASQFRKLFRKGNLPGEQYEHEFLKSTSLPSAISIALTLTDEQKTRSEQLNPLTGQPLFAKYFNLSVEYDFKLNIEKAFTLWMAIKWVAELPEIRGFICGIPFQESADTYYNNLMSPNDKNHDSNAPNKSNAREAEDDYSVKLYSYILMNLIADNAEAYKRKNLLVQPNEPFGVFATYCEKIKKDQNLNTLLIHLDSELHQSRGENNAKDWIEIEDFTRFQKIIDDLANLFLDCNTIFKIKSDDGTGFKYPSVGRISHPNWIVVSPEYYGNSDTKYLGETTLTEYLVHEAGHNAAAAHYHEKNPNYQYNQTGLQSNVHGHIYPTPENTRNIINDQHNRDNMSIKK